MELGFFLILVITRSLQCLSYVRFLSVQNIYSKEPVFPHKSHFYSTFCKFSFFQSHPDKEETLFFVLFLLYSLTCNIFPLFLSTPPNCFVGSRCGTPIQLCRWWYCNLMHHCHFCVSFSPLSRADNLLLLLHFLCLHIEHAPSL